MPATASSLDAQIALSRDQKARRFARAIWTWLRHQPDREAEVDNVEAAPVKWWRELAARIGEREPSAATRALVVAKLREAVERGMP